MDTHFVVIGSLAGLLTLAGGLLLVVAGFKRSVAWGLCNLLVPFAVLVFVIKYWRESRLGFALVMTGMLVNIALVAVTWRDLSEVMIADEGHQAQLDAIIRAEGGRPAAPGAPPADRPAVGDESVPTEAPDEVSGEASDEGPDETAAPPVRARYAFQETDIDFLPAVVGQAVRVEVRGGREHAGVLREVNADLIRIEVRMSGGSAEFNILKSDIERVLVRELVSR